MRLNNLTIIACCLAFAATVEAQDFNRLVNDVGSQVEEYRGRHCLTAPQKCNPGIPRYSQPGCIP